MQISLDTDHTRYTIRAYEPGAVTVTVPWDQAHSTDALPAIGLQSARTRQEILTRSIIISPGRLQLDWPPQSWEDLTRAHMASILEFEPEVVILGTGRQLRWPAAEITAPLVEAGVGLEVMDTAAACRTYNILVADLRRVAAALMMS